MVNSKRKIELLDRLIAILCEEQDREMPKLPNKKKPDCFRALCNVRPPDPVDEEFLRLQDEYLSACTQERGIVDADALDYDGGIALWQGDITRLNADAIVNACNAVLLGCFAPLHKCIDNEIHSNAGVQVRLDCQKITGGKLEPRGSVQVTDAYNLPSRYVYHSVGPVVNFRVTEQDRSDLESCYLSCLNRAKDMGLKTIAFCCLSTGMYRYPNEEACDLAVETVGNWLADNGPCLRVIFDVLLDEDLALYRKRLAKQAKIPQST